MLLQQDSGQKDVTAPLFTAWRNVFFGAAVRLKGAAGGTQSSHLQPGMGESAWERVNEVPLGDIGIFTDGLFENFFEIPLPDATLTKTAKVLDSFSSCVNLQHTALMQQHYQLLKYARALPISLTALYANVVHHGRRVVKFPFGTIEAAQTAKKNVILLQNLWTSMHFQARPASISALVEDCLSHMLRICSPEFDVVSGQIQHLAPQEQRTMGHLTELWDKLGVNIKRDSGAGEAAATGGSGFVLDPPIDRLLYFTATAASDKDVNPLLRLGRTAKIALAQQLAARHELDGPAGEGFTRHTRNKTAEEKARSNAGDGSATSSIDGAEKGPAYVPSDRWKVCLQDPAKAGLGGPEKRKVGAVGGAGARAPNAGAFLRGAGAANSKRRKRNRGENKSAVVFKFKAGFTNAVRRPVRLEDLL
eukprot:INCI11269.1.p1 GENE.INCI11269.1~~INCI11269.1.p1  ORF type:complete len:419 (-),score=84.35 INCI11269.1:1561-2817(-)